MKQNKYDDAALFDRYRQMPRSVEGLKAAGEWHTFRELLPKLDGKRVLDLGCGFGWHCRYAREQNAVSVVGVDISEKMLAQAHALTDDPAVEYRQAAIEDISFPNDSFDVVISSLAFHYIQHFDLVCHSVSRWLTEGGAFVFSVEHPLFTSRPEQDWFYGPDGERLHWPVDNYQDEGIRHTSWLVEDVVKYHRTLATYVNTLLESGFRLIHLSEPYPTAEMLRDQPETRAEFRRPIFLLIAAVKESTHA